MVGSKLVGIDGLPTINLELWDIPGALDPNLEDIYFEGADGVILVFDVANAKQSTADVEVWFDRIRQYEARIADKAAAEKSSKKPLPPLPKLKFGNKRDLIHDVKWHHFDTSKVRRDVVLFSFGLFLPLVAICSSRELHRIAR